jgi:hypothetical protein
LRSQQPEVVTRRYRIWRAAEDRKALGDAETAAKPEAPTQALKRELNEVTAEIARLEQRGGSLFTLGTTGDKPTGIAVLGGEGLQHH